MATYRTPLSLQLVILDMSDESPLSVQFLTLQHKLHYVDTTSRKSSD